VSRVDQVKVEDIKKVQLLVLERWVLVLHKLSLKPMKISTYVFNEIVALLAILVHFFYSALNDGRPCIPKPSQAVEALNGIAINVHKHMIDHSS
jgi:hypothetical protein